MTEKNMNKPVSFEPVSFDEFTIPSYDDWKNEAIRMLKGAPFDKKMYTKTYEGITLQPIYTPKMHQEAIAKSSFPGQGDYLRGAKASGYIEEPWGIAQHVEDSLPEECNEAAVTEIEKGSTVYNIRIDEATKHYEDVSCEAPVGIGGVSLSTKGDIEKLIDGFDLKKYPIYMETGASSAILVSAVAAVVEEKGDLSNLKGLIGADPIGVLAEEGKLVMSLDTAFDEMAHVAYWAKANAPQLRTIQVSGDPYHNGGSNDVQEIAYALSTAVTYIREMGNRGLSINEIADRIMFTISLGANFFMEIAKLRALRVLWAQIMEAFGADEEHRKIYIHGRTSAFTKTVFDPYVNMLRDTTQAFSGVVGGLHSLEVSPFDMPIRKSDAFSRRISRNVQVMMSNEFELRQPVDPVGGSWYVETLAMELEEKIWAEFQKVEGMGGIVKALQEGYVQEEVKKILEERFHALEVRSDVAVGNNQYANMTEELLDTKPESQDELSMIRHGVLEDNKLIRDRDQRACDMYGEISKGTNDHGALMPLLIEGLNLGLTFRDVHQALAVQDVKSIEVTAIPRHRWTERFEAMRKLTEAFKAKHHDNVKVFLANMGPIPQHKPRADFSTGFMEVAEFEVLKNDGFPTTEEAAKAAKESGADVVVICSTDDTYPELVPPLAKQLKAEMPKVKVFLAGMPAKDMEPIYNEAGVDGYIHVKANCYEILTGLQREKGMMA